MDRFAALYPEIFLDETFDDDVIARIEEYNATDLDELEPGDLQRARRARPVERRANG